MPWHVKTKQNNAYWKTRKRTSLPDWRTEEGANSKPFDTPTIHNEKIANRAPLGRWRWTTKENDDSRVWNNTMWLPAASRHGTTTKKEDLQPKRLPWTLRLTLRMHSLCTLIVCLLPLPLSMHTPSALPPPPLRMRITLCTLSAGQSVTFVCTQRSLTDWHTEVTDWLADNVLKAIDAHA